MAGGGGEGCGSNQSERGSAGTGGFEAGVRADGGVGGLVESVVGGAVYGAAFTEVVMGQTSHEPPLLRRAFDSRQVQREEQRRGMAAMWMARSGRDVKGSVADGLEESVGEEVIKLGGEEFGFSARPRSIGKAGLFNRGVRVGAVALAVYEAAAEGW